MRGRQASPADRAIFDQLVARRRKHWIDPRLVVSWTCEEDTAGARRLMCTMGLPDGVKAEVPPPVEKRIAIGGRYLDEVKISEGANMSWGFPWSAIGA